MKHFTLANGSDSYTLRHRCECNTCNFTGGWHGKESEAEDDAAAHQAEPGKQNHDVQIITQQTTQKAYIP